MLTPVAVLAAAAGRAAPLHVAAVLPLARLLAVFARERRGRIENALELHRLVTESEQRLQSILQHSSDLIAIVSREGVIRTLTGSVSSVFGPMAKERPEHRCLTVRTRPTPPPRRNSVIARSTTR